MPTNKKMGSIFLLLMGFISIYSVKVSAQTGQILLPENPQAVTVPTRSQADRDEDLRKKREAIEQKIDADTPPPPTPTQIQTRKLLEESIKPKPNVFAMTLNLALPKIFTRGKERENYSVEPGVVANFLIRPLKTSNIDTIGLWTGFRGFVVSGIGQYEGIESRFSFTYFGPTIGLGRISLAPQSLPRDAFNNEESMNKALVIQSGWFWLSGIAAQSRTGKVVKGDQAPDNELNTKGIAFDSPGLWTEFNYTSVHYSALLLNYMAGVQLGKGKTFVYLGFGTGGLY